MAEHLEEIADDRDVVPEALKLQPPLSQHLRPVFDAFLHLCRCRVVSYAGMTGVPIWHPIAVSEAIAAAHAVDWDPMEFLNVIAQVDPLYVAKLNRRS